MTQVTIAVDAMGGDHAPKSEVEGAIEAAQLYPVRVLLVGREDVVRPELDRHPAARSLPIEIVHASEAVTMEESAAKAVRTKRDSSIRVACRLVRDGDANGWVSAGNTGAVMATAKMIQKTVPGVERPALASVFPTIKGTPLVLLDVGANVDCTPEMLAQFAVMGEVYSRRIFHIERPRVGLLSIGEEEGKGNELTRAAMSLMKTLPFQLIGNVEGRDLFTGHADVIVTDGFVGNVALKVSEGVADIVKKMLRESMQTNLASRVGALMARGGFQEFRRRVDYSEYGGAPLLGVKGNTIICHGRSNANAIKNAIRVAHECASNQINRQIEEELREWTESMEAVRNQAADV